MDSNQVCATTERPGLAGDVWGGLAAMLVALPSAIAFGVLTYTAIGPEYAGAGAMAGILGAAALGLIAPIVGRNAGLISAPCAPAAAVLSALIAAMLSGASGKVLTPAEIMPLLILTALFAAGFQVLFGVVGGGKLIKFIPYPVVSGFLSGVAILIALGQLPKLFGIPKGTALIRGLGLPGLWKWQGLVVGFVTMLLVGLAPRITRKIPAAIIGLLGGIATYFVLGIFFPDLLKVKGNPLVIGPIEASGSLLNSIFDRAKFIFSVNLESVRFALIPALTLSVLLSIDTLKTCVGLDALTGTRHKSDRELIGQGLGNLASCVVGGVPGAGTMGPTLVNVASGGKTYRSGVIEGGFVILALVLLGKLIAWVPIGALAGILLVVAWRMFDKTMFRLLRYRAGRLDFAVIAGVVIVSLTVDLIAASGVGVALAILLFIRDQIRGSVIRRKAYLNRMSSKTRRLASERQVLAQHGDLGVFCELQGNLFFGTTDQLFTMLEQDVTTKRFILLDMRRVQSMDYTAAHLFEQMHRQLAQRGGQLLFSGMPSALLNQRDFEHYLVELGVVRKGGGVMISETLDGALEWMEDSILAEFGVVKNADEKPLALRDFELFREFNDAMIERLAECVTERKLSPGEPVFSHGNEGDEIFLVRRGSVRIMLPLEGGKRHHLATIGRGDFFGEISFLDRGIRSADTEAKDQTELFVLSRAKFNTVSRSDASLGVQVFARMAFTMAERLRETDAELRMLEER